MSEGRKAAYAEQIAADYERGARQSTRAPLADQAHHAGESALQQDEDRLGGLHAAEAEGPRRHRRSTTTLWRRSGLHRLDAVLPLLAMKGELSEDPRRPREGNGSPQALRRRAGSARPHRRREVAPAAGGHRPLPRERPPERRRRGLRRTSRATEVLATLHFLRQQKRKPPGRPNRSLADFVAPKETGLEDHIGLLRGNGGDSGLRRRRGASRRSTTTTTPSWSRRSPTGWPRPSPSTCTERVRKEFWGYATDETLGSEALIREEYRGIRPAPGYPACPEHTEKRTIWELLEVENNAGITLTESCAMSPPSAVSGYYFSHPESTYFGVAEIGTRPGLGLRRAQGHVHSKRPRSGSPRTSATTPKDSQSTGFSTSRIWSMWLRCALTASSLLAANLLLDSIPIPFPCWFEASPTAPSALSERHDQPEVISGRSASFKAPPAAGSGGPIRTAPPRNPEC